MHAPQDHEIKFLVDAATYIALRREAERDDRSMGSLLRHLVRRYLQRAACAETEMDASERPEPDQHGPETGHKKTAPWCKQERGFLESKLDRLDR